MELIKDSNGTPLASDLYKTELPPLLTAVMLDYLYSRGLMKLFADCINKVPRSFKTGPTQSPLMWNVRKRPQPTTSDMYWVSPADAEGHMSMLSRLGSGGFSTILHAIGAVTEEHITHLTVYSLTYLVVSRCDEVRLHTDNDESLRGDVWTVIVPLILIPNSPPELVVKQRISNTCHPVKYQMEEAIVWGPDTEHSTAWVAYQGEYRVCVAVNLGFINPLNVKQIMNDFTQQYPPKRSKLLLEWAEKPHWRRSQTNGESFLPTVTLDVVLGREWYEKYLELVSVLANNNTTQEHNYSLSLRQWMAHQRYCFSLKHGNTPLLANSRSSSSSARTLTHSRECKLREIGFDFSIKRDEGRNQDKWSKMFEALVQFNVEHGHLNVKLSCDEKLCNWIRTQKRTLSVSTPLSKAQKKRKQMLEAIGMKFKS